MSWKKNKLQALAAEFNKINNTVFFTDNENNISELFWEKIMEGKYKYFIIYHETYNIKMAFSNMDEAIFYLENWLKSTEKQREIMHMMEVYGYSEKYAAKMYDEMQAEKVAI